MEHADQFLSEDRRRAFEHGVNTIALKVSSPMGKVFSYQEWLNKLLYSPIEEMEAEAAIDVVHNAILRFDDHKAIENIYIDTKLIADFVPEDL